MTDTMYCCVCRGNIADFYHAIHVHAMAYSLLLAYRHFSSLLSSVFLLSQNWFKKDLTIESLPSCAFKMIAFSQECLFVRNARLIGDPYSAFLITSTGSIIAISAALG